MKLFHMFVCMAFVLIGQCCSGQHSLLETILLLDTNGAHCQIQILETHVRTVIILVVNLVFNSQVSFFTEPE